MTKRYSIETEQSFFVTYEVRAGSPDEAWQKLLDESPEADCHDQSPGPITGDRSDASIIEET